MRIAQVVSYVSEAGEFGGPVAVAVAQSQELARRGHTVDLIAAWDGKVNLQIPGVRVLLFSSTRLPKTPLSAILSASLSRYIRKAGHTYDVIHIHLGRDLVTAVAARSVVRQGFPLIVQTHGMVMPDKRLRARVIDLLFIRPSLRRAKVMFALTKTESSGLTAAFGETVGDKIRTITNGVRRSESVHDDVSDEHAVPQVLFLARLHPRKRVLAFASAALELIKAGTIATFHVVGPDEGDLNALLRFISEHSISDELVYEGALQSGEGAQRIAVASIYVLPSVGEVFPMTVLEALSVGTPVVMTSECAIADDLDARGAAVVTDASVAGLVEAIGMLLNNEARAREIAANGYRALEAGYGISSVADTLERTYQGVFNQALRTTNPNTVNT
jgi:glycosyltransferase involved in cell wall biosynthesis